MQIRACILWLCLLGPTAITPAPGQESADADEASSDQLTIEFSKTLTPEKRVGGCKANLQIEYWQKGHIAEVASTLTNPDCDASSGDYTISVRYRGDDGEMHTDEYPETWAREDSEPIVTTMQYEIGDDVDLIRVRSRGLTCECATDPAPLP